MKNPLALNMFERVYFLHIYVRSLYHVFSKTKKASTAILTFNTLGIYMSNLTDFRYYYNTNF